MRGGSAGLLDSLTARSYRSVRAIVFLWLIMFTGVASYAASANTNRQLAAVPASWQIHWQRVGRSFPDLSELSTAAPRCELSQPPEPLATPDPLLSGAGTGDKVSVSFIIGADGQVHSPVILESAGSLEDDNVLSALRSWRYRPAMCNAAPAESERQVEFSRR